MPPYFRRPKVSFSVSPNWPFSRDGAEEFWTL